MAKELKTTEKIDLIQMNPIRAVEFFTNGAGKTPMALIKFEEYYEQAEVEFMQCANLQAEPSGIEINAECAKRALIRMAKEFII
jgi:hypothetical protein